MWEIVGQGGKKVKSVTLLDTVARITGPEALTSGKQLTWEHSLKVQCLLAKPDPMVKHSYSNKL